MRLRSAVFALIFCTLFGHLDSALAQTATGEIVGRITDNTGAVVTGAEVTAVNEETWVERKTASNAEAYYTFTFLPLGNYTVGATSQGFKRTTQSGIRLGAGQRLTAGQS